MDFRFTEEQDMTADVVQTLLADHCQPADLRRLLTQDLDRDEQRWARIVEMGLAGILVSEDNGGLGLAPVDFVRLAEACGAACLPEPLVENAGIAIPLLADLAKTDAARTILDRALSGEITLAAAHKVNPFVADADLAGAVVIVGETDIHLVERADIELVRQPSTDPFRRLFRVTGAPGASTVLCDLNAGCAAVEAALDRGALFTAAQLIGIAQTSVTLAVEYARERQQFGKPIGSYQAVKHLLAEAQVKIEFARPVLYAAAAQLRQADAFSRARVSHAKIAAAEAADLACRTAVQVHGAMGYSWEVDVHFFLKRALALSYWWGDLRYHKNRIAERALNHPLGAGTTFTSEARNA